MKNIHNIFVVLILSTIIGAIYIYPDIRFILEAGKEYKGIGLTGTSEELLYLSRLNGIYKGSYDLSDIYIFEHQNDPWFRPFIGEFIVGNIGKILKVNIVTLDILMSAILNIILSILTFIFSCQLTKSVRLSIICSFAIMFGYNVFTADSSILKEIFTLNYSKPLWFLRPLSPQFYYIPFLISLINTNRAINPSAKKRDIAIAGMILGLLFYCNVYYWTFIYAGLGVLFSVFLLIKERSAALNIIYIYAISIIVAIPYLVSVIKVINHPAYKHLQETYMMFNSHKVFFYTPYIIPAIFISIVLFIFEHKSRFFIASFLIGGIICLNQQIITGKTILQQWSFYTNKTFLIISILVSIYLTANKFLKHYFSEHSISISNNFYKTILVTIVVLFFTSTAFSQQNNYYHANKKFFLEKQKLSSPYKWLKENTNKTDVVLTDPYQDFYNHLTNYRFLLTHTNNFSYIHEKACMLILEEEANYRMLSALIFLGYGELNIMKYIDKQKQLFNSADPYIGIFQPSEDYYENIRIMYKTLAEREPLELLKKYKVDYILIENSDRFEKIISKYSNKLVTAYKDKHYAILKII
jgi:hypothetical protein